MTLKDCIVLYIHVMLYHSEHRFSLVQHNYYSKVYLRSPGTAEVQYVHLCKLFIQLSHTYGILYLWDIQLTFERWRFRLRSAHH